MRCVELGEKMNNTSVALGQFEALHIGHRAVINAAVSDGTCGVVLTFKRGTLKKGDNRQLVSEEKRLELFSSLGVNTLCEMDFEKIKNMSPEEFVDRVLVDILGSVKVVCGFNYRFGKDAGGDAECLKRLCDERNIRCEIIPPVSLNGRQVSTTEIRQLIDSGNISDANLMLGRPFSYCLEVINGKKLGRTLGTPTINQVFPDEMICPAYGVYASYAVVNGRAMASVTNIGVRPTVGSEVPLSETWICDYDGNLYGKSIEVFLLKYLRGEKRFSSLEELKNAILADGDTAKRIFEKEAISG